MGKKKYLVCIVPAAILAAACIALIVHGSNRPTMKWAKELNVSDISKIELIAMPSSGTPYRLFEEEEFADVVDLINDSRGRYVPNPENLAGGGVTFYITMKDNTVHRVGNNGNTYLYIDEDNYDAGYQWLSTRWEVYGRGNEEAPEGFDY